MGVGGEVDMLCVVEAGDVLGFGTCWEDWGRGLRLMRFDHIEGDAVCR